ncbi:MAG: tetratricopeptide repeat protein [Novosphingobium sp.]
MRDLGLLRRVLRSGFIAAVIAVALAAWPALAGSDGKIADARKALQNGDSIGAEVALREALRQGASAHDVAALMGEAALLQEDVQQARKWLEPEDFAVPDRGTGFQMLGRLEIEQGNLPQAGAAFDKALRYMPRSSQLWVDIARLRYRGGEQLQAINASEYALALAPKDPAALVMRGQLIRDSVGPVAALPLFASAVVQAPEDLSALYEYAATLGEIGRAKTMLLVARRMVQIDGRDPRAYWLQAILATRGGHYDLARRLLMRTGDAYAEEPAGLMLTGVLELKAGNLASARKAAETLVRLQPDNDEARNLLAHILNADGAWAEITRRFGKTALQGEVSPYLRMLVARAYEALNDRANAAPLLDAMMHDMPGNRAEFTAFEQNVPMSVLEGRWRDNTNAGDRFMPYVRALIADGNPVRAVTVGAQLTRDFPGSADVHILAGDANMAAGRPGVALAHYSKAAKVHLSTHLLDRMVTAAMVEDRADLAEVMLARYVVQHPLDGDAAMALARLVGEGGDWKQALALARHALRQPATAQAPAALAFAADAELKVGDKVVALQNAARAYALAPQNGVAIRSYATALKVAGKGQNAASLLAKARAISG